MNELTTGSRVRVVITRRGHHLRNFYGTVKGITPSGMVRVLEDGKRDIKSYDAEHVRIQDTKQNDI